MNTLSERIKSCFDSDKTLNQAGLARACGIKPPSVSGWLTGETKSMEGKNLLLVANYLGVNPWWLEFGKGPKESDAKNVFIVSSRDSEEPLPGYILFDQLDIQVAAGSGLVVLDHIDVVQRFHVLESWAFEKLGGDLSRIKIMTAKGTSMEGTIENGEVLFVDSFVREYDGEGIYVIWSDEDGPQVKRLQKLRGNRLAIISDNKTFETEYLSKDEANSIIVYGRVLASWSLKKFW